MDDYNLYIDESCHLEKDGFSVMCLGYIKTRTSQYANHKEAVKIIKKKNKTHAEVKWHNISQSRASLYKELIDYFFSHELSFHSILVYDKANWIRRQMDGGNAKENLYYDLIFDILKAHVYPEGQTIKIYLDLKDTRGRDKVRKLSDKLEVAHLGSMSFVHFQHIHSHENVLLQLVDLFIGAMTFKARGEHLKPNVSKAKLEFIRYLESRIGKPIDEKIPVANEKFGIIIHQAENI